MSQYIDPSQYNEGPKMAGPQHGFQTGFSNAQQAAMRSQFVAGPGLLPNQQPVVYNTSGMVNQQFGVGVGVVGMQPQNPQQLQQQQLQLQQQQQQQMQQQQQQVQQQQQQAQIGGVVTANTAGPGVPPGGSQPGATAPPPGTQSKEFNTASLCRYGQETVQDIQTRTQEVFQTLKSIQPPNGTVQASNTSNEKKVKIQDQLRIIKQLFKRLRVIYEKCNDSCQLQGMEYMHIESLIPLKEEWDMKSEEKKTSEQYRLACDESKEIMEQVVLKNKQLKEVIDHLRRIISEINTMLTMRRS